MGLRPADIIGKRATEVLGIVEPSWLEQFGSVALTGQPLHHQNYSAGLGRWYELFTYSPKSGQFATIFLDVTDRKQIEQQLEAERAKLTAILESVPDELWFVDNNESVTLVNRAVSERFDENVGVGQQIEHFAAQYEVYRSDGTPRPVDEAPPLRALRGEIVRDEEEIIRTPATGELRHRLVTASPATDSQGNVIGSVTVVKDITERKQAESLQQELLEREHNIAKVLQQAILPPEIPPETLGYRIAAVYRPALKEAEIGGDFYDVFELANKKLAVLIGDVAGKGLQAALRVSSARHAVRSYAYIDPRPGRVLTLANEALCRESEDMSQILTAFFAVLDSEGGTMSYASAGHEPPIVFSAQGGCDELQTGGLPLGLAGGFEYEQATRRLDAGDLVVMVTDGITEARAPGPVMFEKEGLVAFVQRHRAGKPEKLVKGILDAATEYAGGQLQDDAAVMVLTPLKRKAGR